MEKNSGFATKQIHTGKIEIPGIAPLATPIFQTSTFEFETTAQGAHRFAGEEAGYIYTRLGNPNTTKIGEKLAALEHAEAGIVEPSHPFIKFPFIGNHCRQSGLRFRLLLRKAG